MKEEIVLKIAPKFKNTLAAIRDIPFIEIAEYLDFIWLKCTTEKEEIKERLYEVRFKNWYVLKDNYLFQKQHSTPEMRFFEVSWTPVHLYFKINLPIAAFSGKATSLKISLQLENHLQIEESIGLLTTKEILRSYLIDAPNFRFKNLKYAESDANDVFIFGTPFLPIQGITYWKFHNILLPNGKILKSKTHLALFKQSIADDSLFLITSDNTYQEILTKHVYPLTRKAIVNGI